MKKIKLSLALMLLFPACTLLSQELATDDIPLKSDEDYKSAEPVALKASTFVLSLPLDPNNENRTKSIQFVLKWMSGTPNYSFSLDDLMDKLTKDNPDLLGVYLACMVKYALENPASAKDDKAVKLGSVKLLLGFCENSENKVKMTKVLKKLADANKKGELQKAL